MALGGGDGVRAYRALRAVVVGISRYADPGNDLLYARPDAEVVASVLVDDFGFDEVEVLLDADATRERVSRSLVGLRGTDEDDGVVVFFAGHGVTLRDVAGNDRGFLVPHDGDVAEPFANVSLTHVRDEVLPYVPAKHVFLVVDACYSGLAFRDVRAATVAAVPDAAVIAELTRRERKVRQVLSAGSRDQRVLDGGRFGHSVFTDRLVEALQEADPFTTADRVGVLVRDRVTRDSLDRKVLQTPQFGYVAGGEGTFVFERRTTARRASGERRAPQDAAPSPVVSTGTLPMVSGQATEASSTALPARPSPKQKSGRTRRASKSRGRKQVDQELFAAIERGDVDALRDAISAGANVSAPDRWGRTPLTFAAKVAQSADVVRVLVSAGADPEKRDRLGYTPLTRAATASGHPDVVSALVAAGARVDAADGKGRRPIGKHTNDPVLVALLPRLSAAQRHDGSETPPLEPAKRFNGGPAVVEALKSGQYEDGHPRALEVREAGWVRVRVRSKARVVALRQDCEALAIYDSGGFELWEGAPTDRPRRFTLSHQGHWVSRDWPQSPSTGVEGNSVSAVAFSPDGGLLAIGSWRMSVVNRSSEDFVQLLDARSGRRLHTLRGHTDTVEAVALSPDGRLVASGSLDKTVWLWDAQTGRHLHTLEGHTECVDAVTFSPDGGLLASGSRDESVRLWDALSGRHLHTVEGRAYGGPVAFSPDGRVLASVSSDGTVGFWDLRSGRQAPADKRHTSSVNAVAFSPDGGLLASGHDDGTLGLWDAGSGRKLHTIEGHTHWVDAVAFSADGGMLVGGSRDGTIGRWTVS